MHKPDPDVVLIVGSASDAGTVAKSGMLELLDRAGVVCRQCIISAHRHDRELTQLLDSMRHTTTDVYIGVGGMALALPGAIAAKTNDHRVVLGVALASPERPDARDATEAIIRLPLGTAVGFCGIGKAGLLNAAILACQIVGVKKSEVLAGMMMWRKNFGDSKPAELDVDLRQLFEVQKRKAGEL